MTSLIKLYSAIRAQLHNEKHKKITVATDCSGIEAPLIALDILGIPYEHVFSSEVDENCAEFIDRNFNPHIIYNDIKKRNNSNYERKPVDLYIAGFPCQTFSSLGRQEGFNNRIKGTIFFYVYDFIVHNRPNIFILENVRTLTTHDKGQTFTVIMDLLSKLSDYQIDYQIINTNDYGLPQSRNRIFIVGIKKSVLRSEKQSFKQSIQMMPIIRSLPLNSIIKNKYGREQLSLRHQNLYDQILEKYPDIDFNDKNNMWILNMNVSGIDWFRKGTAGIAPCIVTSSKYYIPSYQRYLLPTEALNLQGIPTDQYNFDFPDNVLYKFAGNTMSVNILLVILVSIFNITKGI